MPAGVAYAPGGIPLQFLVFKLGLGEPQHKVGLVPLGGVFFHAFPHTHSQIFRILLVEHVVFFQPGGVEIHIAFCQIGVAFFDQAFHHGDEFRDAVGGRFHNVRDLDVKLFTVGEESVGVELRDFHDGFLFPLGTLEHFVLAGIRIAGQMTYVRDVHNPLHFVADVPQVLFQHVFHDVGTQVADVGEVVYSGAAGVHTHLAWFVGDKFVSGMGKAVV